MDSNNVKQDIDRLLKGFTSLDPSEFDSAIHEFFKIDASIDNSMIKIKGASRIREFTALSAHLADSNQLVGKPSYDEKKQVVDFKFQRKFRPIPVLSSLPVISSFVPGHGNWVPVQAQLHLKSGSGDDDGKKLYVSRVNVKEKPQPPIINALFYYILRPFFSLFAIFISNVSSFYYRHIKDTWFQFIFAAINEFVQGIWTVLLREQSHVSADASKWREAKGQDLRNMIDQAKKTAVNATNDINLGKIIDTAKSTAINVTNDVELRARNAGVPVDQYKKQAGEIAQDLQKRVQEATGYAQGQVEKGKKQAGEIAEKAQKKGGEVAEQAQKKGGEVAEQAQKKGGEAADQAKKQAGSAKDQAKEQVDNAKNEAKKQADSNGNGNAGSQKKDQKSEKKSKDQSHPKTNPDAFPNDNVNEDDVPTTPLGGHDPTAPNAFSYAHAVEE